MLWAGLIAVLLALVSYFVKLGLWTILFTGAELLGAIGLFCLVCLSELLI